jgi:uncharacterized protein
MSPASAPWYRHRWPWILMSGPAAVVIAATYTAVLAVRGADGLVAEDYYRRGLAINRTLARAESARHLGVRASLVIGEGRVRVALSGPARDAALRLTLVHPVLAERDARIELRPAGAPGAYEGALPAGLSAPRRIVLEDLSGVWRLAGAWDGSAGAAALEPQ